MSGPGTVLVVAACTLGLAVGMLVLGAILFALSMWSNRAADRLSHVWDARHAVAQLVGDIHIAHSRYRAGDDITGGARPELP